MYSIPTLLALGFQTYMQFSNDPKAVTEMLNIIMINGLTIQPYLLFSTLYALNGHFKTHLCIGGYAGDLSITIATNDVIFWLFHQYLDYVGSKYHLSRDELLVPNTYNMDFRLINKTQQIVLTDIEKDTLTYYENITVKETFQLGYGELCFIHDQMLRNEKPSEPLAVQRLRYQLPPSIFAKIFSEIRTSFWKFNFSRLCFRRC